MTYLQLNKFEIVFRPECKRVFAAPRKNLLDIAKSVGVDLTSICGGQCKCGKCKVIIEKGRENAGAITRAEKSNFSSTELSIGYRLACCINVLGPLTVRVPEESRIGLQRLQIEGIETPVKLEALIKKCFLQLPLPTLQDQRSDLDRLLDEISVQYGLKNLKVHHDLLKVLPLVLRSSGWKLTVVIWSDEKLIGIEASDTTERKIGFAVDIGTTKLAGYLLNLNSGKVIAAGSLTNPQLIYGDDIITRISYAMKGSEEQEELQRTVVSGINQLLTDLCKKTGISSEEIYEATAVGNGAMHHMFLGLCPKYLALSPYTPVLRESVNIDAKKIGLKVNQNGNVYILPLIAGFVGADAVALVLATEIYKRNKVCIAFDIGTNTEVILGNRERILACSCASGPAFEGGHIKYGMMAETGAIEKVKIDSESFDVEYQTVDHAEPRGICGSGLIDILAEMLKSGIMDVSGTIRSKSNSSRLRLGEAGPEFVLAWERETSIKKDIVITQKDVRELQLAKGAIHAGAITLMKKYGVTEKDIDKVFLAGAFGSYVDPVSGMMVGMYPEMDLEKLRIVGNAAGTGARIALLSKRARKTAEELSKRAEYIELSAEPSFSTEFLNSQYIPYADLSMFPRVSEMLKKLGNYPRKMIPIFK